MSSNDNQPQLQDDSHIAMAQSPSDSENSKAKNRGGKGRRKIEIKYIDDKTRRQITFSKRKAGLMKKAYELSTLTGTQILVLVTSETGHVYTFATKKFQPFITDKKGKNLIQQCLSTPELAGGEQGELEEADQLEDQENPTTDDKDPKKEQMMGASVFADYQRYGNVNPASVMSRGMGNYSQMFPQQMGQLHGGQGHLPNQYFQTIPIQQGNRQGSQPHMQHGNFYDQSQKDSS